VLYPKESVRSGGGFRKVSKKKRGLSRRGFLGACLDRVLQGVSPGFGGELGGGA